MSWSRRWRCITSTAPARAAGFRAGPTAAARDLAVLDDRARAAAVVAPWVEAGCTWRLETRWEMPHDSDERMRAVRDRLEAGPPVEA